MVQFQSFFVFQREQNEFLHYNIADRLRNYNMIITTPYIDISHVGTSRQMKH